MFSEWRDSMEERSLMRVESNIEVAYKTFEMILSGDQVKDMLQAGQFLHLKMKNPNLLLRRPISIASIDEETCTLLYKVVGKGTEQMSEYEVGDQLDVLGPLGNGFHYEFLKENDTALVIGGGIGVAPLYELGKRLVKDGIEVTFVLGFASAKDVYYEAQFRELGNVVITTDDGSQGVHGHVGKGVDTLKLKPSAVFACGPLPLNMFVQSRFSEDEHVYLSLEERMACGIGACYACDTKKKDKRVCHDGPVFHRREVDL